MDDKPQNAPADIQSQRNKQLTGKRKTSFIIFFFILLIASAGAILYYQLHAKYYEETDDAYVNGNLIVLSPQITGTVTRVVADEGDYVEQGQEIVRLDPSETEIALQNAQASLAGAVRQVRGLYSTADNYRAQLAAKEVAYRQAQNDYNRRRNLLKTGAISAEDLTHYREALDAARNELDAARQALNTQLALVDDTLLASHPDIKTAVAQLRQRYLDHARTRIIAPVSGFVAKRAVQLGNRVQPGSTLLSIVPLNEVWVDANFKENQMREMRIGQQVTLVSDLYGSDVSYTGEIESLGIGTGSAFSLLPAQNASGNWIKIVQRLPVKVRLHAKNLEQYPLRIGLSMTATVSLKQTEGALLANKRVTDARYSTDVYDNPLAQADEMVARILHENGAGYHETAQARP